jgi:hypothetical protein
MKQGTFSATQESARLLWNPEVRYRVNKSLLTVPVMSQINPIHTFQPVFPETSLNNILPSTSMSSEWSLSFRLSCQIYVRISHIPMRAICPAHLMLPGPKYEHTTIYVMHFIVVLMQVGLHFDLDHACKYCGCILIFRDIQTDFWSETLKV